MRITVKIGLIFAAIWIAVRMIPFLMGNSFVQITPFVMMNILCVLLAIAIGLYLHKKNTKEDDNNLLGDIKNGMSAGLPYTMVVSLFLYFYYGKIDPAFNAHKISEFSVGLKKDMANPISFQKIKDSNPEFEVKTRKEIYDSLMQGPKSFFNAGSTMVISMLALLLLSTIYSILVSVVFRRLIFRN
ncbi:MAG: hypothetical protein V4638_04010 [Bacteroidota bacterium]